jgi:hypothetical protein
LALQWQAEALNELQTEAQKLSYKRLERLLQRKPLDQ